MLESRENVKHEGIFDNAVTRDYELYRRKSAEQQSLTSRHT
jgi:hypothetical protein